MYLHTVPQCRTELSSAPASLCRHFRSAAIWVLSVAQPVGRGFAAHPKGLFSDIPCRAEKTPNYRDSNTSPFRIFTLPPNAEQSFQAQLRRVRPYLSSLPPRSNSDIGHSPSRPACLFHSVKYPPSGFRKKEIVSFRKIFRKKQKKGLTSGRASAIIINAVGKQKRDCTLCLRQCWNRQTGTFEGRVSFDV